MLLLLWLLTEALLAVALKEVRVDDDDAAAVDDDAVVLESACLLGRIGL